ncbi:hypothetical protein EDB19DRAFT_1904491 [Suillus lakei]|nr:hypothetical protein EDB19DRAFT_1904491 [Suillus lakei]
MPVLDDDVCCAFAPPFSSLARVDSDMSITCPDHGFAVPYPTLTSISKLVCFGPFSASNTYNPVTSDPAQPESHGPWMLGGPSSSTDYGCGDYAQHHNPWSGGTTPGYPRSPAIIRQSNFSESSFVLPVQYQEVHPLYSTVLHAVTPQPGPLSGPLPPIISPPSPAGSSIPPHSHSSPLLSCRWQCEDALCTFRGTLDALKFHFKTHSTGAPHARIICRWVDCQKRDGAWRSMRRDTSWRHVCEVHLGMKRGT